MRKNLKSLFLFVLLCVIYPGHTNAGERDISFIYKPRYVSAEFILTQLKSKKGFTKMEPEGSQDFIEFGFMWSVHNKGPDLEKFVRYIAEDVDTINNGIRNLGFKDIDGFRQKYSISKDQNSVECKLIEILGHDSNGEEYSLKSNKSMEEFLKDNDKRTYANDDTIYGPQSAIYDNYLYIRYLGLKNPGWRSGGYESSLSPVLKSNLPVGYLESSFEIWFVPVEAKIEVSKYKDRLVLPKYLGTRNGRHIFALARKGSPEEMKLMYERLSTMYLLPLKESINKILKEMKDDFAYPYTIISNQGVGKLKLGDKKYKIYDLALANDRIIDTSQTKGSLSQPTIFVYPEYHYSDYKIAAEYKKNNKINFIYLSDPRFSTKEGIIPTISKVEFDIITNNNYSSVEDYYVNPGIAEKKEWCRAYKIPGYDNVTFIFVYGYKRWTNDKKFDKDKFLKLQQINIGTPNPGVTYDELLKQNKYQKNNGVCP